MNAFYLGLLFCSIPGWLCANTVVTPRPISGRDASSLRDILPADVLARAKLLSAELELIRFEMGKPQNTQPRLLLRNAAPREVFFQALTLFQKSNRLSFEQTRSRGKSPERFPAAQLTPGHVWHAVDKSLQRVLVVKRKLGIKEKAEEVTQDISTTPTEVFVAIVIANRQLNLLLEQRFSPSDVYQQVSRAMNYTARLLGTFPEAQRFPDPPAFERGKRPDHVYKRLLNCYALLDQIAKASSVKMLELTENVQSVQGKTPSDVYDIASLLVSELAYLHSLLENVRPPVGVYYPGRKFPSHVYQRAGILEYQLKNLAEQVQNNPLWFKRSDG